MATLDDLAAAYAAARHVYLEQPDAEIGPLPRTVPGAAPFDHERALFIVWTMPSGAWCGLYGDADAIKRARKRPAPEIAQRTPKGCSSRSVVVAGMEGSDGRS